MLSAVPSLTTAVPEMPGIAYTKLHIFERLSAFRRDLGVLGRDGKNESWAFVSVEKIKLFLNTNAEKYGLFFEIGSPDDKEEVHHSGSAFYATALVHLRAVCLDDPTQTSDWKSHLGFALQESPRDTNITNCAQTQAIKYGLHKLLLLVSGDADTDRNSGRALPQAPKPAAPALQVVPPAETAYRSLADVSAYLAKQGVPPADHARLLDALGLATTTRESVVVVGFTRQQQKAFTATAIRAAYDRLLQVPAAQVASSVDEFDALLGVTDTPSGSSAQKQNKGDRAYANSLHVLHLLAASCPNDDPNVQEIRRRLAGTAVIDRPTLVSWYRILSRLSSQAGGR